MTRERFPPTHWSLVVTLQKEERPAAWAELCEIYYEPVYAFVRRLGNSVADSEDLVQSFFLDFLGRDGFAGVDQERGRLRTYLLTALQRFLAKCHRHDSALKRGGGKVLVSLDVEAAEREYLAIPATETTSRDFFDRRWAAALFARALAQLKKFFEENGKVVHFEALKSALMGAPSPEQKKNG